MRNIVCRITGPAILVGALIACGTPNLAMAGVNVGVSVNIGPPPIFVPAPPALVLMPRSQVYFVPGLEFDVFFYNGYWWSPRGDRWYRSRAYGGPWRISERRFVPGPVSRVPHDYRNAYARERHIPYQEWRGRNGKAEHREMRQEQHERRGESHEGGGHMGGHEGQHGHGGR